MFDMDKAVEECKQGPTAIRRTLMDAYTSGTEDAKDFWCKRFAAVIDELAMRLDAVSPGEGTETCARYEIWFDDNDKPN